MIKSVTRTLYIDGKPIAAYTQDPMADSELADIEQIAARMELLERPKKTQGSADVGNDARDPRPLIPLNNQSLKTQLLQPGQKGYDPKKPNKRKHPEAEYFTYYSLTIKGKTYWANVKMHKDLHGEVLYTIGETRPPDLIKGKPE